MPANAININKIKLYITCAVFLLFPIMSIVDITDTLFMNISLADVFVLPLGMIWVFDIRNFKLKKHFHYYWYFLLYIVILVISNLYNTRTMVESAGMQGLLSEAFKMATNAVIFFIAYNSINEDGKERKWIFISWLVGLYIFILYGIYAQISYLLYIPPWTFNRTLHTHIRFIGTLTDANAAALYLSVSFFIVIMAGKYIFTARKIKICLYATCIITLICVGLTLSRGGVIGFLCGLAIWALLNIKTSTRYIFMVPLTLCLLMSVFTIDTLYFKNRLLRSFYSRVVEIDTTLESGMLHTRYQLSLASVRMGLKHPIIGIGRGNFPLNSEAYLLEQGADMERNGNQLRGMVSHNTIAGIFAEMGILGLCAFLSLFISMIVKIVKQKNIDYGFKMLSIALWTSIMVQSMSISLENARVFWLTAGLFLCILDKKIELIQQKQDFTHSFINCRKNVILTTVCFMVFIILYAYVAFGFTEGNIELSDTQISLQYQSRESGRHTLRYSIRNFPLEGESVPMEVFIRNALTKEVVGYVQYHNRASGYANIYFDAEAFEWFDIEFAGSNDTLVGDIKINTPSGGIRALAGQYPLLPECLYAWGQRNGYLVSRTSDTLGDKVWLAYDSYNTASQVTFGEKIQFKGVEISKTEDEHIQFEFTFVCLGEIGYDYFLLMRLVPTDIHVLNKDNFPSGSINFTHRVRPPLNEWEVGKEYKYVCSGEVEEGIFQLRFGFWHYNAEDEKEFRLRIPNGSADASIGWFEVQ